MPKLSIIFFLILLIYINIGYNVQVYIQKELAKEEMNERIIKSAPDSCLIKFELNPLKEQIAWQEEGKEFWLSEELYDVVKISFVNGKAFVFCLNDKTEQKIINNYRDNVQKKASSNQGQKNNIAFFAPAFIPSETYLIKHSAYYYKKNFNVFNEDILHQDKQIFSPPPKA